MTPTDRREGARALEAILAALLAAGGGGTTQEAAELRRRAGALSADALERVEAGDFAPTLRACFEAATAAGATYEGMDKVRAIASGFTSVRGPVQRVTQTSVRYSLVQISLIVSQKTFRSRSDVDAALARINAAFEPAEEFAADRRDNVVFRALVALHASVVRDLTQRARPLARIVPFNFGRRLPALHIANRLYGDGGRAEELIKENKIVHPLFALGRGVALGK